jgi:hypothetical protein
MAETFAGGVYTDSAANHSLQTTDGQFVPEVWIAQYLTDLEAQLILGSSLFTNRDYEGHFTEEGDVLRVPHFVDTVRDFDRKAAYEGFTPDQMDRSELEYIKVHMNKGSSFRFELDRVHQWQTKKGVDHFSNLVRQRARKTAHAIDALVAQTIVAAIGGKDLNTTESKLVPTTLTAWNNLVDLHGEITQLTPGTGQSWVYNAVVDMLTELDNNYAPQDRVLVIAPSIRANLLKDPNFTNQSNWGGTAVMPTGTIGEILGVPVIVSPALANTSPTSGKKLVGNLHTGAKDISMVMTSTNAVSLLMPFAEMKAYEPEAGFTQAVKSRLFYDAKVIRPEQVVTVGTFAAPTSGA